MNNIIESIKKSVYRSSNNPVKNIAYKEYVWDDKQELLCNDLYSAISGVSYEMTIETDNNYTVAHFTQYNYYDHDDKLVVPDDDRTEYGLVFVDSFKKKPQELFFKQYVNYVQKYSAPLFPFLQSKLNKTNDFLAVIAITNTIELNVNQSKKSTDIKDTMLETRISEYDYFIYIHNLLKYAKDDYTIQSSRDHYLNKFYYHITNQLVNNRNFVKSIYDLFNDNYANTISCEDKNIIIVCINSFLLYYSYTYKQILQNDEINLIDKHFLLTEVYTRYNDAIKDNTTNFSIEYFEKTHLNNSDPIDLTDYSSMLLNDYAETMLSEIKQNIDGYVNKVVEHLETIENPETRKFNKDVYIMSDMLISDFRIKHNSMFIKVVNYDNYDKCKEYFDNSYFKDVALHNIYKPYMYTFERDEEEQAVFVKELFDKDFEFMMFIKNSTQKYENILESDGEVFDDENNVKIMNNFFFMLFKELCNEKEHDYITPMFKKFFKTYNDFTKLLYVYNIHISYLLYRLLKTSKNNIEIQNSMNLFEEYFDNAMSNNTEDKKFVRILSYENINEFANNRDDYSKISSVLWLDLLNV